jgi:hypothetical protein
MAKKLSPFEQAFADARKEYLAGTGPKNFTFNGKLYNTNLAGEGSKKAEDTPPSTSRQSVPPRAEFVGGVKSADQSSWDSGDQSGGVKPKNRSSWDSTFGEDAETGFDRAKRGESPLNDAIMGAGKLAIAAYPAGKVLSAVRPAIGAAVRYMTKKDSPISKDVEPELFTPGMKRPDNLFGEASARDFKKGGRISLDACKVSTHKPAKKNPNF